MPPRLPVTDECLARLVAVARHARDGCATELDALALLEWTPELLDELLRYRRALAARYEAFDAEAANVARIPARPRLVAAASGPDLGGAA